MRPQERASMDQESKHNGTGRYGVQGGKLASLATTPNPLSLRYPLTPNRPFQREESHATTNNNNSNNNRTPSIRSASSFNRSNNYRLTQHHTRHLSGQSNFSTMSETSLPWTTRDIGFNAISGVLNDPAKRIQSTSKSKAEVATSVEQAMIPRIKSSDFQTYLDHIRPVFDRYQQNKQDDLDTLHFPYGPILETPLPAPLPHHGCSTRNPYTLPNLISSESLPLEVEETNGRLLMHDLPMLENVPAIFFQSDFCLENPRTFDAVCEGADIIGNSGPNPPVSTNSILQEKLSYYLDTVEVHLIHEIENRSFSFFEALSNLQALHQQTLDCVAQIHTVRQKMKEIQSTACVDGLKVVQLQIRYRNLQALATTMERVKEVRSAQPMIQILLGQGDYFGALDLMDETRDVLEEKGQTEQHVDLKSVRALANFSMQLDEMEKAVGFMMQHDFMSVLMSDLHGQETHMSGIKAALVKSEEREEEQVQRNEEEQVLWDQLIQSTKGLLRTNMLTCTVQAYKDQLLVEIKECIRKYPLTNTHEEASETSTLAKQLKTMPFDAYFEMLLGLFAKLLYCIQRATVYERVICRLVDSFIEDSDLETVQHQLQEVRKELAQSVYAAADLAHVRCGKLVGYRSDQNALLNPTDFYRLSSVLRHFIQRSEKLCSRTCFGLRGTVVSQQKAFVEHFHMERIKQEVQLIENDPWIASEVPPDFQSIVDRICQGSVAFTSPETAIETGERTKFLIVHGESYFVVGCSLLIIKMFEDYLRCSIQLEGIATDIMQKLVELLKLFNSRVCQVILGAGAMRSAGFKNISAKHLVKDYQEHQSEIHAKLVAIMDERFAVHIKAMQIIQWDDMGTAEGSANQYMETLVKEILTLHKVLSSPLCPKCLDLLLHNSLNKSVTCTYRQNRAKKNYRKTLSSFIDGSHPFKTSNLLRAQ
ncbi:hypothetical protein BDF14DRAFT_1744092 [Spinellus fusiger]|nr:hypothetical protein BDF14DRAFT_1744092 [Spinellus fusiger]